MKKIHVRLLLIITIVFVLLPSTLCADSIQDALPDFYQGNYAEAYSKLRLYRGLSRDQHYLLESLTLFNLRDTANAQIAFKKVNLKVLRLGPYETALRLKFSLLQDEETGLQAVWIENLLSLLPEHPSYKQILLDTVAWYQAHHRPEKAKELLVRMAQYSQGFTKATYMLGRMAVSENRDSEAKIYTQTLLQKSPLAAESTSLLNQIFHDKPEVGLSELITNSDSLLKMTRTWFQAERYIAAKVGAKVFIKKYPQSSDLQEVLFILGMSQFSTAEYEESIAQFQLCLTQATNTVWTEKAQFYLARAYHKQKKLDQALEIYKTLIQTRPQSAYVPEATYYAYWIYKSKADMGACEKLIADFQSRSPQDEYLDRVLWEYGWDLVENNQIEKATTLWASHTWTLDTEVFRSKQLYWLGKLKQPFDPEGAQLAFKTCLDRYPYSYYSFRIKNLALTPFKQPALHTDIFQADDTIMRFYQLGLGDWMREDLEFKSKDSKLTYSQVYTLSRLQSLTGRHYQSVNSWYQKGLSMVAKDGRLYRDVAKLLYPRPYWQDIQNSAQEFKIDPYLLLALMREESLFNPGAKSKSGALGLTQIMPETGQGIAKSIGIKWTDSSLLTNPTMNIRMGAYYVSILSQRFDGSHAAILSGYNAGPNITKKWTMENPLSDLDNFVVKIPYTETQAYVPKVLKSYWMYKWLYD